MSRNTIIPYNPEMRQIARRLRTDMTLSEVLLWKQLRNRKLGVQFHRQVPMEVFAVDFYCHELMLAIEVDGCTHDNPQQVISDNERQRRLEAYGVKFISVDDADVKQNLDGVVRYIAGRVDKMKAKQGRAE